MSDTETKNLYKEGNTLFCVGNSTELSTEDGVIDEYKLMPYLSEDGDQNVFVLNVNRYVGLSKHLEESGNEQKLEDAKHVLEVLSTEEGMWALNDQRGSVLLPLNDATVEPSSYYSEVIEELNSGHTAPFIYAGWDDIIVPIGEKVLDYIKGDASLQDVIDCVDENQSNLKEAKVYTTVTETLDTEDCAKLVGIGFAKAVGADAALISKNELGRCQWIFICNSADRSGNYVDSPNWMEEYNSDRYAVRRKNQGIGKDGLRQKWRWKSISV